MAKTIDKAYRRIPAVDKIIDSPKVAPLIRRTSHAFVITLVRRVLDNLRQELAKSIEKEWTTSDLENHILDNLQTKFDFWIQPALRKVINATGVILHTNLGRAPVGEHAQSQLAEIASNYSTLEFDLAHGKRHKRDLYASRLLEEVLHCQQAIVVNNNAAAVFLILNSLAEGGEVLISRGEMIEIGDSFRIPDVLKKSGAILREVGTTNKTRLADYQEGLTEKTKLILRVHPSNFRITGFTSKPSLLELTELCSSRSLPLVEDLGSGCLTDLNTIGIKSEPNPAESIASGVQVVCFSGDKLLGGGQAGIIAGSYEYVQRIRKNPLFRALRVDKLALAVLESTLISYLTEREGVEIPVVRMMRLGTASIEKRALEIVKRLFKSQAALAIDLVEGYSVIGGGSTPSQNLATKLIRVRSHTQSAAKLESLLRNSTPPVLVRCDKNAVLIDLRTVFPSDEPILVSLVNQLGKSD